MTQPETFTISRFATKIHPPVSQELSWSEFVALFSEPRQATCGVATCPGTACRHKDGAGWAPAAFHTPQRSQANVAAVSLLVFDIDHHTEAAIAAARDQLARYRHLIYATHSDRPGHDRCLHVVVHLSRPVKLDEWKQLWRVAMPTLAALKDPTCCDAARLYFLPSRPHDAPYFVTAHEGEALDVDAALAANATVQEGVTP